VDAFARHIQSDTKCKSFDSKFLDHLSLSDKTIPHQKNQKNQKDAPTISATLSLSPSTARALQAYQSYKQAGLLLSIPFTSCDDYFFALRSAAKAVSPLGPRAMLYFAAAVSDFYVASDKQATHKIQSAGGPLTLVLDQTPKLLGVLRKDWAPSAFCVSFKLETNRKILLKKARRAISKYGMDAVVANEVARP
jgi:phosphopantothenate---cysteine ligase (ATP)